MLLAYGVLLCIKPPQTTPRAAPAQWAAAAARFWRDGTSHIVMEPLEFMQRLAALVPRPRLHLIRFHGVLAPNAKLRSQVVPKPTHDAAAHTCEHAQAHSAPVRMSWARLLKRVFDIDMERCECGGNLKFVAIPSSGSGQGSNSPM